jgi:hypothetical protein
MDWACTMNGEVRNASMHAYIYIHKSENLKGQDHFEDLGIDRRVKLK